MDLSVNPAHVAFVFCIFMATVFVLQTLVFKPTLAILAERERRFKGLATDAKKLQSECEKNLQAYNKLMDEAKAAARKARDEILRVAESECKSVLAQARSQAEEMMNAAKAEIHSQCAQARLDLRRSVTELSRDIVDKILKRKAA